MPQHIPQRTAGGLPAMSCVMSQHPQRIQSCPWLKGRCPSEDEERDKTSRSVCVHTEGSV